MISRISKWSGPSMNSSVKYYLDYRRTQLQCSVRELAEASLSTDGLYDFIVFHVTARTLSRLCVLYATFHLKLLVEDLLTFHFH